MDFDGAAAEAAHAGLEKWPGVALRSDRFRQRLLELGIDLDALRTRGAEIYLAVACSTGDPFAIDHFERDVLSQVGRFVGRLHLADHQVDEVRQQLRVKLLTGANPGIARYSGRGPLAAWVRVSAVRLALDLSDASAHSARESDVAALGALVSDGNSPEMAAAKNRYRPMFQAAVEESLLSLDARDKTLLRLHYLDGLNIDAIGRVYRVHRATVARWIVAIRERVLENLKAKLAMELRADPSEARSVIALFESELHLSVQRLLRSPPA